MGGKLPITAQQTKTKTKTKTKMTTLKINLTNRNGTLYAGEIATFNPETGNYEADIAGGDYYVEIQPTPIMELFMQWEALKDPSYPFSAFYAENVEG